MTLRLPVELPDEGRELPLITLLDARHEPVFSLLKLSTAQEVRLLEEGPHQLRPGGSAVAIPTSGAQVYAGYDTVVPGSDYSLTIGVWAGTHPGNRLLASQVKAAAIKARYAQAGGLTLPLTTFTGIDHGWRGAAALGSTVKANFAPGSSYWFREVQEQAVPVGLAYAVDLGGDAPCDLRVTITAGDRDVVNPTIDAALGRTTFGGTVPAGQTLVISELDGEATYTLSGVDRSVDIYGPQPQLRTEQNIITITAPGASARIAWQEGIL